MFKLDSCRHSWAAVRVKELLLWRPMVTTLNFHWKLPYALNYWRLSASAWTKTEYVPDKPGCCCPTTTPDIRLAISQWVNSVPAYVQKLHFIYEAIRTSGKCHWNMYRTPSKCRWSIYRTSRKRRGTLRIVHKVERSSPTVNMLSSNGNIFHVTGPLCGEFIGHWWIPLTKASELWCFLWSKSEQMVELTIEMSVIWEAIALVMTSL